MADPTAATRRDRRQLAPALRWTLVLMVTAIAVAVVAVFASAASDPAGDGTSRFDPRRCPPADDDGVIVLIVPGERGREMCHYIDRRTGRDLTPPYEIPALPAEAVR